MVVVVVCGGIKSISTQIDHFSVLQAYETIMVDPDLYVANGGRVKNGFLKSFAAPGGYRDLKINPVMEGTSMVCEVRSIFCPSAAN